MNGNSERTSSLRCPSSAAMKSGSCSRPSSSSGGNSGERSSAGVVSEVARNALNTRVQSWQVLVLGQGRLEVLHGLFSHAFLQQLPTLRIHCKVAERQSTDGSQDLGLLHGS